MATCQASWPMIPWGCSGAISATGIWGLGVYDTNKISKISLLGYHWQRKFGVISGHTSDTMNTIGEYFRIFALHENLEDIPVIPHFQTDPQWGLSWWQTWCTNMMRSQSKRKWRINTMIIIVLIRESVSQLRPSAEIISQLSIHFCQDYPDVPPGSWIHPAGAKSSGSLQRGSGRGRVGVLGIEILPTKVRYRRIAYACIC